MNKIKLLACLVTLGAVVISTSGFVSRLGGAIDTTDPEKELIRIKNGEASLTMGKGSVVTLDLTADDGVTAKMNTGTAGLPALCITEVSIAVGAYGECRTYGPHPGVFTAGTTQAVVAGSAVVASATTGHIEGGLGAGEVPIGIAFDSNNTATATTPIFVMIR